MYIYNFYTITLLIIGVNSFPEQGKWDVELDEVDNITAVKKSLLKESKVYTHITCDAGNITNAKVKVGWILSQSLCWQDFSNIGTGSMRLLQLEEFQENVMNYSVSFIKLDATEFDCNGHSIIPILHPNDQQKVNPPKDSNDQKEEESSALPHINNMQPIATITKDGIYVLTLFMVPVNGINFHANVYIEMVSNYGYLSAADRPLLTFYGDMCLVYLSFGIIWLTVSFLQWRDLLRIQYWIGAVILLGMLEKAMFYAEFYNINSTGQSLLPGTIMTAEIVSCAKRTLARMVVIIVSLGFGIVKPRLGSHLPRVIVAGCAYFILAALESYQRVMQPNKEQVIKIGMPLALLDSFICWWIFSSLVQTIRTLRLRRNVIKLALYNHFTNTLIFAVVVSIIFMLYAIKEHRITNCITDWKSLWVDDAFWHVLFSIILLVIMILWRPTNNNQRYAFSPLLDAPDDEDDEEVEQFVNESYGVKMRGVASSKNNSPKHRNSFDTDEEIKWVEQNLPSSLIDARLPIVDSDEELMNMKFEMSKMN